MNMNYIYEHILPMLSEKRLKHTKGVIDESVKLSELYGMDKKKAEVAALCHDIFRGKSKEHLNALIREAGLPEKYMDNPNLAHGKLAAYYIKKEFGIVDEDILNAVSYHTTGRANMSLLEKIVFIADAIEPGRDFSGVEELRKLAYEDLDRACLRSLKGTINHLLDEGKSLNEIEHDTIEARDYFLSVIEKEK